MIDTIKQNPHFPNKNLYATLTSSSLSRRSCIDETSVQRAQNLLAEMTLQEKLGQLNQVNSSVNHVSHDLAGQIQAGMVGSVINENKADIIAQMQSIAVNESRLGIPLLIGRDVIHGFSTIFPLPIAMASSFDPSVAELAARISSIEAAQIGINWTFSPMIDISRDARWGRIAESFGEDPVLCSAMTVSMVRGYQTDSLSNENAIAACAKHFVGYGASEAGRDYNTTNLSDHDLRNVYMPPFKAASDSGVASIMTSFSDVNGVPVSGNKWLLTEVLRDQWQFDGVVVSDWESVSQLIVHGLAEDMYHAAYLGLSSGVDIEMVSATFIEHGQALVNSEHIAETQINEAVLRVLSLKFALGLFDKDVTQVPVVEDISSDALDASYQVATKSCVLLKNENKALPLNLDATKHLALIGCLAEDEYEMLGTWIFDGDPGKAITIKEALEVECEARNLSFTFERVFQNSRDHSQAHFEHATRLVENACHAIVVVGEESILSGEAHCRADISLPGAQLALIERLAPTNTKITLVVMAGRPVILTDVVDKVEAILYAWHPGAMGGKAITDLLLGTINPSAKLPVSFLRHVGQTPLYYGIKNTGRPVSEHTHVFMDDFPDRAPQTSLGMSSSHIDQHFTPLFPFGYGLSYSDITYSNLQMSHTNFNQQDKLEARVTLTNNSEVNAIEIVQLYIHDPVASLTRPVKELKQFKRLEVLAGESKELCFELSLPDFAFYRDDGEHIVEEGEFTIFVGASSATENSVSIRLSLV